MKNTITAEDVKTLRRRTGAGLIDCKKALTFSQGDQDLASEWLRLKGTSAFQNFITKNKVKSIIHVNRQHIAMNAKDGKNRPVYTIKQGRRVIYAREVHILGPSVLIYNGKQLNCGARAWIETYSNLELTDEMSFKEARLCKN